MKRTPFSLALNSMDRAMTNPPQTQPGAPIDSPGPPGVVRIGLKGECRSPTGSPRSCGDIVPALMSVLSASFIIDLAALARDIPPP